VRFLSGRPSGIILTAGFYPFPGHTLLPIPAWFSTVHQFGAHSNALPKCPNSVQSDCTCCGKADSIAIGCFCWCSRRNSHHAFKELRTHHHCFPGHCLPWIWICAIVVRSCAGVFFPPSHQAVPTTKSLVLKEPPKVRFNAPASSSTMPKGVYFFPPQPISWSAALASPRVFPPVSNSRYSPWLCSRC